MGHQAGQISHMPMAVVMAGCWMVTVPDSALGDYPSMVGAGVHCWLKPCHALVKIGQVVVISGLGRLALARVVVLPQRPW
jgi:hypothetical protein